MALPTSPEDIANMAMVHIGERFISNIEDPVTDQEVIISTMYDTARQTALRQYIWNFSLSRIAITRQADTPLFGFPDAYSLPDDFIRFVRINNLNVTNQQVRSNTWKLIENKTLLYNGNGAPSIQIEYVKDVIDVSKWTSDFADLVSYFLALKVAMAITKEKSVVKTIDGLIERFIPDAISITTQENPLRRVQRSKSIEARRGNVNTWWGTQSGQYVDTDY